VTALLPAVPRCVESINLAVSTSLHQPRCINLAASNTELPRLLFPPRTHRPDPEPASHIPRRVCHLERTSGWCRDLPSFSFDKTGTTLSRISRRNTQRDVTRSQPASAQHTTAMQTETNKPAPSRSRSRSSVSHPDSTDSNLTSAAHEKRQNEHDTVNHAPHPAEKATDPLSPRSSRHHPESLRRTESHHSRAGADGYTWRGDGRQAAVVEEPYLVAFDGDADPECPRSMSTLRRWMIVLICASSSLCV
jgi:hypothetical protein